MAEPQDRFKPLNENASQKRDETADRMSNLKSPTVGLRADDDGTEEVISLLIEEIVKNKEIMQAQIDHITDLRRQLQETQDTLIETRNQRDIARQYNNNLRIHYHESAQLLSRYEKQYGQLMESAILKELKARVRAQEEHLNQLSLEKDYSKYAQMNRLDLSTETLDAAIRQAKVKPFAQPSAAESSRTPTRFASDNPQASCNPKYHAPQVSISGFGGHFDDSNQPRVLDDPATLRADNLPGKGQGKMLGGHEMDIDGTIPESVDGMSAAPFGNFARPISRAISITTPVMKPADVGQIVDISDEMIRPQTVKRNKESHEPLEHVISHLKAQPLADITNNRILAPVSTPSRCLRANTSVAPSNTCPLPFNNNKSKLNPRVKPFIPSGVSEELVGLAIKASEAKVEAAALKEVDPLAKAKTPAHILPHLRRLSNPNKGASDHTDNSLTVVLTAQQDLTAKIKEKTNSEEHIAMGNEESIIRTVVEAEEHPVGSPTTEEYSFSEIEDALCVAIDRTAPTDKDKKLYNEYNDGPMQVEATDFLNPSPDSRLAPHLRHMMKKATDADTVQPIFREKVWSCNPAIKSRKSDAAVQAWLDAQEAAAQPSTLHSNEEKPLSDTLIDFASNSPVSEKKKVVPVPPGFTPVEPKTPAVTTNRAEAAPDAFKAEAPAAAEGSIPGTAENDATKNGSAAAFVAGYGAVIEGLGQKYGKPSKKSANSSEQAVVGQNYSAPPCTSTHVLGALLDDKCKDLVMRPSKHAKEMKPSELNWKVEDVGKEWKVKEVGEEKKRVWVLSRK